MTPATLVRRYQAGPLVAYHESGHALVAHRLGRRVERVAVGFCRDSGVTDIAPIYDPYVQALVLLAGERAERRSISWLPGFEGLQAGSPDRRMLTDALLELQATTPADVDALIEDVDGRLRDDWLALDRLAKRLDDQRVLTGPEIAELVG